MRKEATGIRREFLSHKHMEERVRNLDKEEVPGEGLCGPRRPPEDADDADGTIDEVQYRRYRRWPHRHTFPLPFNHLSVPPSNARGQEGGREVGRKVEVLPTARMFLAECVNATIV